jgi:4-hydroxybenzoyl-CoA thioesterase
MRDEIAGPDNGPPHGFPLVETGSRYFAPLHYDDLIVIDSQVAEVRTKGLRIEHTVRRGDTLVATGFEVRVYARFDPTGEQRLEARPIPEQLRGWLASPTA